MTARTLRAYMSVVNEGCIADEPLASSGILREYMNGMMEARMAPLYHMMDTLKAKGAFTNDRLEAVWNHDIPGLGNVDGISLSRDPRVQHHGESVVPLIQQYCAKHNIKCG